MSSLLSADLAAACNALGYSDAKSNKYYADANTLETVKDLIRYLRRDDEVYDIRRQLGDSKVLQTDLLPLLKSYWEETDLFDILLRLIVNLTTPPLILWNEEVPSEKTARNFYLQIEGHLQSYKEAFADEAVWAVLSTRLSKILENDYVHRGDENSLIIERILILIRNVLYVPADSMEKRPDNDASVHDQVLWALHQSGMLDIILYITSSANESAYYLHILEILSFMLREQNASELAHAALQRSQTEKVRDEAELLAIRHREVNEKQKKSKMFTGTRHSRFGGTFVVKSMKSISDNELIYHKPLGKLDALNFDVDKTKPKTPKNRLPVKATSAERRSAFSIRLFLKEFCIEFLNGAYNTLMYYVKDNLVRAKAQAHDESYYLWAMRFFMEFNRCYNFEVKLVSETMSVQTFHYVQQQSENFYDMLTSDKKKLKLWSRRLHLALLAYKELFLTLSAMDKSPDGTVRDSSKVIKSNIFYVLEYREFILTLLINYDELKMSDVYLKDLIETQHVFLKIMETFIGKEGSVVVQSKSRKKKKRSRKAKNTGPIVQELNLDNMWDETSAQLSSVLESTTEFPTDIAPFDAASDTPIDDQKTDAMKNVQRKLRNGESENAIGLLHAAREVWPENDSFGSPNMAPEEEFLALRDIFFADLGENRITVESAIANEVQSEYDEDEEDEEEGGTIYNENNFKFVDFSKRLPHPKIVRACGLALKHFDTNTVNTNHCIIKLLHRIAFDCKMYVMIFQLGIFRTFQKLFKTKDSPQHKELVKFATYIVRQFIKVSETNKKVFMEALFWKSSKECYDIEHGYMEAEDRSSAAVRAWSEEQEDEVRRLFMEHQQTGNNEDVVDFVTNNLIDQTKTRRQVLKKLKELMLLVNYRKKSGTRGSRAPKNWTPQEEITLQELFEQYRESDDPLGNIMDNLDIPRSKNRIVEKLLIMGLIQDKKEVRKKRARKGERSHPHNSDNDIVNSSSSDSDDDSISSQRSASSNVAAPTQRRPKKAVSAKIKKPAEKKKPVKRLPVSKSRIAEMIIKVVDLEMHDALEWLKESLSDAIEDYEVENNEGIPLVPIMDYAETAMENPEFQRMLKSLGVSPPFDEQEVYWRIPVHLPLDTLKNYSDMIQQALDKTLQIQEESHSTQASTPAVLQDRDSSDDEDVFGKLRKMTKSDSPDRVNRQLQNDKVTLTAINENSSDSVDQDIAASSNGMKGTSSNRKKSRLLAESDEDSVVNAQENEDTALVEDIIKENMPLGENISSGSTSSKKKKFRIIPESDEESEDENSKAISSEQGNQVEETSFSSKTRDFLESDSEEETEKACSEAKRIRSVSDSESEKPAAKRVRILDSDDDDD